MPDLRTVLEQIGGRSSALLDQLRVLLDVLRRDPLPEPQTRTGPPCPGRRRMVDLLTARHVRIAATAVLALLAVRAAVGDRGEPAAEVWVQVGGLLACALAVWRPGLGVSGAVLVVLASLGLGSTSYWDVGLRGIRERVELTHGTFSAGPEHGQWVLAVSLPVATRTDSSEGPYVPEWDESVALPAV